MVANVRMRDASFTLITASLFTKSLMNRTKILLPATKWKSLQLLITKHWCIFVPVQARQSLQFLAQSNEDVSAGSQMEKSTTFHYQTFVPFHLDAYCEGFQIEKFGTCDELQKSSGRTRQNGRFGQANFQ